MPGPLTLEKADAGAAGFPAEGADGQQQRAVALGQLQVGAALVQQHHGVNQPLAQAGAELLVGDDVFQGQGALGAAADDGAEADVAGAADVRGVEGEEGAAVEDEALRGALLQQPPQRLALQRTHPQVHHGGSGRGKEEEKDEEGAVCVGGAGVPQKRSTARPGPAPHARVRLYIGPRRRAGVFSMGPRHVGAPRRRHLAARQHGARPAPPA